MTRRKCEGIRNLSQSGRRARCGLKKTLSAQEKWLSFVRRVAHSPGRMMRSQTACKPGSVIHPEGCGTVIPLDRPLLDGSRNQPGRLGPVKSCRNRGSGASPLFGLAPGGACHAVPIAGSAVGSYPTLSPLPMLESAGGLLSVALSLGSPPAGVTRRHLTVEPGLSSTFLRRPRPPGRLAYGSSALLDGRGQSGRQ
jgi:hypothetical protein